MNIPKYISDIIKKARLTNGIISLKKSKLSLKYAQDRPGEDFPYIPETTSTFLVDLDGVFLTDSDDSQLID